MSVVELRPKTDFSRVKTDVIVVVTARFGLKVLTVERSSLDAIVPAGAVVPLLFGGLCRAACKRLSGDAARGRTADTRRAAEGCENDVRVCMRLRSRTR